MNVSSKVRGRFALLAILVITQSALAQSDAVAPVSGLQASATANSRQTAQILGLDSKMRKLRALQSQRLSNSSATLEEISLRQELLESVQASFLEVDSVIAELTNEQSELGTLRTSLQSRRDKTVSRLTSAALITGSGLGVAVSATQFTTLSNTTQNVGNGIGIGSGAASTILSVLAARRQRGPNGSVADTPNMLAPLLGGTPVLNTYYPPAILQYLQSVPVGQDPGQGTRLQQLMAGWDKAGRLSAADSEKRRQKVAVLTSSGNSNVKVSIDDLTDRMAMLGDLRGRVSLMKRDLAVLMRSYTTKPKE